VLQVERVITAPEMFGALAGSRITVRFKKGPAIKRGSTLTVFANGWIFGASIAVDAVGYTSAAAEPGTAMLRASSSSNKDAILSARLRSARLGVVGTVSAVAKSAKGPGYISEHDPHWHEATIEVDEVVKGKPGTRQVTVLFPLSDDIRWHKIGKYEQGQQGIWVLQKGKQQDPSGIA